MHPGELQNLARHGLDGLAYSWLILHHCEPAFKTKTVTEPWRVKPKKYPEATCLKFHEEDRSLSAGVSHALYCVAIKAGLYRKAVKEVYLYPVTYIRSFITGM